MDGQRQKKRALFWGLNGALLLLALVWLLVFWRLGRSLYSQYAWETWQGEGELRYAQVSCFLPVDESRSLSDIYQFRMAMLSRFHEAALDVDQEQELFVDAWSCTGSVNIATDGGRGQASVIAVGGDFFQIHPLRLLSGSYLSEKDLMKDRVLLDEDLAWLIYGGTELEGMPVNINGVPFLIGGVIRREQDSFSKLAYTAGQGLYMSYDAYVNLVDSAGISCYELVMAEPVEGFTLRFVQEKFPIGRGEILQNSGRFGFFRALGRVRDFGKRSMQTLGVIYPYWENAARGVEDWCSLLALFTLLFLILPLMTALILLLRLLKKAKYGFSEKLWPRLREGVSEAVRKRQRRAWEKRHPGEK